MKRADLHTGGARLGDGLEQLQVAWQQVTRHWKDESRHHFEEEHLDPIAPTVRMTLDALTRLSDILARAERECEDGGEFGW